MSGFESVLQNLDNWGYWVVFAGAMVEGEVILLSASAAAAMGYLDIYKVFWIALGTTIAVDQGLFLIGHKMGSDWLIKKFPKLKKPRDKAFEFLKRMDVFFIFAFRFIWGIRTISPIIIGSAEIKFSKFAFWNILSGLCWASFGCYLGYSISSLIASGKFSPAPLFLCITLGFIGLSFLIGYLVRKK